MLVNFTTKIMQRAWRFISHNAFRFLTMLMFTFVVAASTAHATTVYSDSWLDDSNADGGFIVGCGLTEVNYGDDWELHQIRATTTIRSPDGRTATRTGIRHYDWSQGSTFTVRAEPLLAWDFNDTGDYRVSTRHYSTCPATELGTTADIIRVGVSNAVYVSVQSQPDGCIYRIVNNCNTTCKTTEIKITNPPVCRNYLT